MGTPPQASFAKSRSNTIRLIERLDRLNLTNFSEARRKKYDFYVKLNDRYSIILFHREIEYRAKR